MSEVGGVPDTRSLNPIVSTPKDNVAKSAYKVTQRGLRSSSVPGVVERAKGKRSSRKR